MTEGWGFPFGISGEHGRVKTSSDRENIRESVKIILLTEPGERKLHPTFGSSDKGNDLPGGASFPADVGEAYL